MPNPLDINVENRAFIVSKVRAEVVGPEPIGVPVSDAVLSGSTAMLFDDFYAGGTQADGEEVLWRGDPPTKRYGAGVLYPAGLSLEEGKNLKDDDGPDAAADDDEDRIDKSGDEDLYVATEKIGEKRAGASATESSDEFDVTLANAFLPSAVGISFLADFEEEPEGFFVALISRERIPGKKTREVSPAFYEKKKVQVKGEKEQKSYQIWCRRPISSPENPLGVKIETRNLLGDRRIAKSYPIIGLDGFGITVVSRPWANEEGKINQRLITVALVNKRSTKPEVRDDENCLFQSGIKITGLSSVGWICPYPEKGGLTSSIEGFDERVNRLTYREIKTFAIGHGCAADWDADDVTIGTIWSDYVPCHEIPSLTPDLEIVTANGERKQIQASMRCLAGLDDRDDGIGQINEIADEYANWINSLTSDERGASAIPDDLKSTAEEIVQKAEHCLSRIVDGIALISEDNSDSSRIRKAFRLANEAMLRAQLKSDPRTRDHDPSVPLSNKGYWRPFQIAFLLMSIRGVIDESHPDRDEVDLIWFPTGGGKTEAYLGLVSFALFYNRLAGKRFDGVEVLMRYTLRLLTSQQFQRASRLFCAMEFMRENNPSLLGEKRFTLGLYVGESVSPNRRERAVSQLNDLIRSHRKGGKGDSQDASVSNPFVVRRCPWCDGSLIPNDRNGGWGYEAQTAENSAAKTVHFKCQNAGCHFGSASVFGDKTLPLVVIDDDVYDSPPSMVIGTVDKFAQLAWNPRIRSIFGINENGEHFSNPPMLVIQDELHLISGPLGTMVGIYETLIDRLCRKNGYSSSPGPKIVASTATISRAREQVRALYGRQSMTMFPASGLEESDSFFSRIDRNPDGSQKPGRLYLGVMAPGYQSMQTTERTVFATLLQAAKMLKADEEFRDPWWTLLCFFNSIRELGSAATLVIQDVRDHLRVLKDRYGFDEIRKPFPFELTSRLRDDEVSVAFERLETRYKDKKEDETPTEHPVDVCLASSIIEVGVDVPRLSLMSIVGQPKSTSQYIQVSSRVGRDKDKPGLVVCLYGQSKPRDRSHYERFKGYHQKLYSSVEPTSVTPFSGPAVDRALHAVVVAAVRQFSNLDGAANNPRFNLIDGTPLQSKIISMIEERARIVLSVEGKSSRIVEQEVQEVLNKMSRLFREWNDWNPSKYGTNVMSEEAIQLIYPAGQKPPERWGSIGWPTMTSLRNVDAMCEARRTYHFNEMSGN